MVGSGVLTRPSCSAKGPGICALAGALRQPKVKFSLMKESYIAAKERWARKMAGKERPAVRSVDRLPPGQRQVHNFPTLDLGVRPEIALDAWELKIHGQVENPVVL